MNPFIEHFKNRLANGILLGCIFMLLPLTMPLWSSTNPFAEIPTAFILLLYIMFVIYGIGWYFGFNLLKRVWRKSLRTTKNASIWQAITGRGFLPGLLISFLILTLGFAITAYVGIVFAVIDFIAAKKGKPPVSMKYKFDSDLEYDEWAENMAALRSAVSYNDIVNGVSDEQYYENRRNLDRIENGYTGSVITDVKDGNKTVKKKTTFY